MESLQGCSGQTLLKQEPKLWLALLALGLSVADTGVRTPNQPNGYQPNGVPKGGELEAPRAGLSGVSMGGGVL